MRSPPMRAEAAVVALKPLGHAKSRLAPIPAPLRSHLAWCMAVDTLRALMAEVDRVVVVSEQAGLGEDLDAEGLAVQVLPGVTSGGINGALSAGAQVLVGGGAQTVVACVADLPALRPASVRRVLTAAAAFERSYLSDASGTGTTMLIARRTELNPHFQGRSAAAHHHSGAVPLPDDQLAAPVPDARRDVDTEVDLADAYRLGVGRATAELFDPSTGRLGRYARLAPVDAEGKEAALSEQGDRLRLPPGLFPRKLDPRPPDRHWHAVVTEERVLALW